MNDIVRLDDPSRIHELRALIQSKGSLRYYFFEIYQKFVDCLSRCPKEGIALEIGSGAGFIKDVIPDAMTSDTIPYEGVDRVVDAMAMPFGESSVRAIFMLNVFHHIPDVSAFLKEAERVLVPGGRVLIVDQFPGYLSSLIFKYVHHEPYDENALDWKFESTGPLSGANGALAWIVFQRDREKFQKLFPGLRIERFAPHSPLRYWLIGGMKNWSLIPAWLFPLATWVDRSLARLSVKLSSFVDVELVKAR
jgi:SAM-dependent methyltransferase